MRIYQHIFGFLLLTLLTNCSMKEYGDYKELHKHNGNEKYEIVTLVKLNEEVKQVIFDSTANNLIVQAFHDPVKSEDYYSYTLKINHFGSEHGRSGTNRILKDGTDWYKNTYSKWIINGDTTKKRYEYPINKNEAEDKETWFENFKHLYENSSYVYIFQSEYYFNVDSQWHKLWYNEMALENNFQQLFPPKEEQKVRMVELEDRSPAYYVPPEERDSSLIREIDYEPVHSEEVNQGWNSRTYSAGWWYLQVFMPGGDTLRIKRYSDIRNPRMKLYKIPEQYGGRDDVLFIVQEPKDAHMEQVGGMYVVRPRELKADNR